MLQFAADPIPTVRVAFIGLGMRGLGAVKRMTHIPSVETVDFCDVKQENTEKCNHMLAERAALAQENSRRYERRCRMLLWCISLRIGKARQGHAEIGMQAMDRTSERSRLTT